MKMSTDGFRTFVTIFFLHFIGYGDEHSYILASS
jgi:hypothetical protein